MSAALAAHELRPPRAGREMRQGAALALSVHALLVAVLSFNIPWTPLQREVVSAEMWTAIPQSAPRAETAQVEPTPTPPPAAAQPETAPPPAPSPAAQRDADIALEKERQRQKQAQEEKTRQDQAKKERVLQEKAEQARIERDKAAKEKVEKEKAAKEKQAREKAEEKKRAAAEEAKLAKQREDNLKRMMGQAGSATGSGGNAAVEGAPSASYAGRLYQAIFPNILFNDVIVGNPAAEVEVRLAPNGSVIGRRIVKSSGLKEWDEAVLRAIDRTGTLPRDVDGRVPPVMTITFRPKS